MKIDIPEIIREIPFHFTGFVVLMLAGLIRIVYDGTSKISMIIKSVVLLILLGTLISILASIFEWDTKWVVIIMSVFGYLSGFLLNALINIGKRIEEESPNWFEMIIEGAIKKRLNNYVPKSQEIDSEEEETKK